MATPRLQQRLVRGRGASSIRTPRLIRDYLSGEGDFPEDTPEERAARPTQGDYIARMHRRIKRFIQATAPGYQYPRRHSFGTLVNHLLALGLLEETGAREDPADRGAGALGTARGFQQRVFIRLAAGAVDRREWSDPIGFMSLIYPNLRPAERPLPAAPPPPAVPTAPAIPAAPPPLTRIQALEQRRQAIVAEARNLAGTGNTVEEFQNLLGRARAFINEANQALPPRPFPAAEEALTLLRSCIRLLDRERVMSPQRVTAITNCQASSRLLAEALASPLVAPRVTRPGVPPVVPLPEFELPQAVTRANVGLLARHLGVLQRLGTERGDVRGRLAEIAEDLERWSDQLNDAIARESATARPRPAHLESLRRILDAVEDVSSSLGLTETPEAIEALDRAYPGLLEVPEEPAEPEPVERELPPVPSISLPTRFSTRSIPRLLDHLQRLADLAEEAEWPGEDEAPDQWPAMTAEVSRLLVGATVWRDAAQDVLGEEEEKGHPSEARKEALQRRIDDLDNLVTALDAQNLAEALEALEGIETME